MIFPMSFLSRTRRCARPVAPLAAALLAFAALIAAAPAARSEAPKGDPRAEIAHRLEVPLEAVRPSAIPGLFEVAHGAEVVYVTADSHYVIQGDLYDADHGRNLTAVRRNESRQAALKTVTDDDAIIFTPKEPRYTISVFTDVDCQYCRRLHNDIAELNRLGVRVRYLFFPRTGPNTSAWHKAEAVWCSANRQEALTRAKQGIELPPAKGTCHTPVSRTYALGQELGIRGTPGVFTDRGDYVSGYLPPEQMVEKLKQLESGG
jgi:thiol:disulfide interchange protein DsbC